MVDYQNIAVIGGGLVGPLLALLLNQKGYNVTIYECKDNSRITTSNNTNNKGWSFDLALSKRGLDALEAIGLKEEILKKKNSVKVFSRLIHKIDGSTKMWKYCENDDNRNGLLSIERKRLNEILLDEAESRGIPVKFQHELQHCNPETGELCFETETDKHVSITADFIFGCDGAHSTVRMKGIMLNKNSQMNFSQHYIPEGYHEIHVPPTTNGDFALDKNHLHLWPRDEFMLMSLPNPDHSITMTLFMPNRIFNKLNKGEDVTKFFETYFPDAINVIGGTDKLVTGYFSTHTGSMISVKCEPHCFGKVLLLGDAAHAMVPFFGQGVNAGFEDCIVFQEFLELASGDFRLAANNYSAKRFKDAHSIVELSLYNHDEMRQLMNSHSFWLTRNVKKWLNKFLPFKIQSLYSTITFTRVPYSKALEMHIQQSNLLYRLRLTALAIVISLIFFIGSFISFKWSTLLLLNLCIILLLVFCPSKFEWKYGQL